MLQTFQVFPVFMLGIYTSVYGYIQPYKLKFSNMIELAVSLNFLLLLILNATSYLSEEYFVFHSVLINQVCHGQFDGVAVISWILMPLYYLPPVALCITGFVFGVFYARYV